MLRDIISEREADLPYLTIRKFLKMAEEDKRIISLGPGEPDFDAPPNVIRAAKQALTEKKTHYTAISGISELKTAIKNKLRKDNKIRVTEENIMITTGCTEGLALSFMATLDAGEGALIPNPGFLAYLPLVEVLSGAPLRYPLLEEQGFQITFELLKKSFIKKKTRILVINSPSNPLGTVFTKKTLEEIADFVHEHDIFVISDETYEKLIYGNAQHISIGSLNGMQDHVLTLNSFSKAYAMPGFRIGYAAGPEKLISAMSKLKVFTTLSPPTTSQYAALEALTGQQQSVETMRSEYDKRRRYVVKRIQELGLHCVEPDGAFYAFPNISRYKKSSLEFCEFLAKRAKVLTIPGTEFGSLGEGFVRLSYATALPKIKQAFDQIERIVGKI